MPVPPSAELPLEIRLFGVFDVKVGGQPLPPLRYRKEQWLLALLALRHDRDTARAWLAATLWPENEESQGLFYLRKALSNLRNALGPEARRLQSTTTKTLRLDLDGAFADLRVFDAAIARQSAASDDREVQLVEALNLYRGPVLQDCLEEWVTSEREPRVQSYLAALETVAEFALSRGEAASASRWLRLALAAEPWRESAACSLMRALADSGDRAAVRLVYQDLRLRMRNDLASTPSPETEAVYRKLAQQDKPQALAPVAALVPPSLRHLPVPLTDLIGRDQDVAEVGGWLDRRRLVTLLGSGGVGKTRLAIAAAEVALPRFPDGVWFVDLAPVTDASYVPDMTARALGLALDITASSEERLIEELRPRRLLLVLDNCEHLADACAILADRLLGACPDLRILATSRQALGITGEQVYRVPSLAMPSAEDLHGSSGLLANEKDPSCLMDFAAIRLFVQRAVLVNSAFRMTRRNGHQVVEICRHLDGIPLAIELAAARTRTLTVEEINGKLDQRFRLLTGGSRAALPRQQTLRALIDWSYDLLGETEKTLLARVSVFSGSWDLEAAETVCASKPAQPGSRPIETWALLDLLTSLVDKSLVLVEHTSAGAPDEAVSTRYRLLESVRQYGQERLLDSGETVAVHARHRNFYLALAEHASDAMEGPEQALWFTRLEMEHDNLRAALDDCAAAASDPSSGSACDAALSGLRLAGALWRFWWTFGYLSEGGSQLARALAARPVAEAMSTDYAATQKAVAAALNAAGVMASRQSDYASAKRLCEEALSVAREIGDKERIAKAIMNLGIINTNLGNYAEGRSLYEQSLPLLRELGQKGTIGRTLHNMGRAAAKQGNDEEAQALQEESLRICREIGDKLLIARTLQSLSQIFVNRGDYTQAQSLAGESLSQCREIGDRNGVANTLLGMGFAAIYQADLGTARTLFEDSLEGYRKTNDRRGVASSLGGLGGVAFRQGDYKAARSLQDEGLILRRKIGDRHGIVHGLLGMAAICSGEGNVREAVALWAAAGALREALGMSLPAFDQADRDTGLAKALAELGEEDFAAAAAKAAALSWDDAVAMALRETH